MQQSIKSYRVKDEYKKHAKSLFGACDIQDVKGGWSAFKRDSTVKDFFEEAGVLDIWYDIKYTAEFKPGDWITINNISNLIVGCQGLGKGTFEVIEKDYYCPFNGLPKRYENTIQVLNDTGVIWNIDGIFREATTEEMINAKYNKRLTEAKEKYPIGTTFNSTGGAKNVTITENSIYAINRGSYEGDIEIMRDTIICGTIWSQSTSRWAEIVNQYPEIKVNGYVAEFLDYYVKFGCAQIGYVTFTGLYDFIKNDRTGNRSIQSVQIGDGNFTYEDIKAIANYAIKYNKIN